MLLVDLTAKLPDGTVIDTTRKEDAPENIAEDLLKPRLVSLGYPSFVVMKGLETALTTAELNVPQSIDVDPVDAYGKWDRRMVRMVAARKLDEPEKYTKGDEVTINGRAGIIKFMGSGRVQIDYNHKYAGKIIHYDFTVTDLLETDDAKVKALLEEAGMVDENDYTLNEDSLEIPIPNKMIRHEKLQNIIYQLQTNLFRFVPNLSDVRFIQHFQSVKITKQLES